MIPSKESTPDLEQGVAGAGSPLPDAAEVRLQLERLLTSAPIRGSQRCRSLLKHVVGAWLNGTTDRLKERTIGHEVFGRDADYDTNQDSVVRTAAAEVRKRLAQYYLEPGHETEIRVLLPSGSYFPEFRPPAPVVSGPAPQAEPHRAWNWKWLCLVVAGVAVLAGAGLWFQLRPTELDQFWAPLIDDRQPAVLCIGQPSKIYTLDGPRAEEWHEKLTATASPREQTQISLFDLRPVGNRFFFYGDVMASLRISELLAKKGKPFTILGDRATSYLDLRGKPAILVGQFNNRWTIGLMNGLRYYMERNAQRRQWEVRDRRNGDRVIASITQEPDRPAECAIVSRVFDPSTEKTVVSIAGMTYSGTLAAGDFLTNPAYVRAAFQSAPAGWQKRNIQVVLKTTLVGGAAGPPKVLATHFW